MYICIHICTNISDKKDLWRQHCVLCYCRYSIYIYIFIKLTLDHYIVQHNKQLIQVALVIVNYHTCLEWCSTPFLGTNITCYIRYFKSCLALLVYCILGYIYTHFLLEYGAMVDYRTSVLRQSILLVFVQYISCIIDYID